MGFFSAVLGLDEEMKRVHLSSGAVLTVVMSSTDWMELEKSLDAYRAGGAEGLRKSTGRFRKEGYFFPLTDLREDGEKVSVRVSREHVVMLEDVKPSAE